SSGADASARGPVSPDAGLFIAELLVMVGVPGQDRARAVQLLDQQQLGQPVGQGQLRERQLLVGELAILVAEAVGVADRKVDAADASIAPLADPRGERRGRDLLATLVEDHPRSTEPGSQRLEIADVLEADR